MPSTLASSHKSEISPSAPLSLGYGTRVVLANGEIASVEKLKNGDQLMGPDGSPRTISGLSFGFSRLFQVSFGHLKPLRATGNHPLQLRKHTIRQRANWSATTDALEAVLGPLPEPESQAGDPARAYAVTRHRPNIYSAIASGIAYANKFPSPSHIIVARNKALSGTTWLHEIEGSSFTVIVPPGHPELRPGRKNFHWHNYGGGGDFYEAEAFPNRELAFEAAKRWVQQARSHPRMESLANLKDRVEAKIQENAAKNRWDLKIKVDSALRNIQLYCNILRSFPLAISAPKILVQMRKENAGPNGKSLIWQRQYTFPEELPTMQDLDARANLLANPDDITLKAQPIPESSEMRVQDFKDLCDTRDSWKWQRVHRIAGYAGIHQKVPVHPYFIGLWAGDGAKASPTIFNNHEPEVRSFLSSYASLLGLYLTYQGRLTYAIVARPRGNTTQLPETGPGDAVPEGRRPTYYRRYQELTAAGFVRTDERDVTRGRPFFWIKQPLGSSPAQDSRENRSSRDETPLPHPLTEDRFPEGVDELDSDTDSRVNELDSDTETECDHEQASKRPHLDSDPPFASALSVRALDNHFRTLSTEEALQAERNPKTVELPPDARASSTPFSGLIDGPITAETDEALSGLILEDTIEGDIMEFRAEVEGDDESDISEEDIVNQDDEDDYESENEQDAEDEDEEDVSIVVRGETTSVERAGILSTRRRNQVRVLRMNAHLDGTSEFEFDDTFLAELEESVTTSAQQNPLLQSMRSLGIMAGRKDTLATHADKKRIPQIYMTNDRETRLQVLAGMIDSDGCYVPECGAYVITQNEEQHEHLFYDVVRLARSCGFQVSVQTYRYLTPVHFLRRTEIRAVISGNLTDVPCLLGRKQAYPRERRVILDVRGKYVQEEEDDESAVGFSVDGDGLFLREDYLVLRNPES